jgi:hypothetical protein
MEIAPPSFSSGRQSPFPSTTPPQKKRGCEGDGRDAGRVFHPSGSEQPEEVSAPRSTSARPHSRMGGHDSRAPGGLYERTARTSSST